MPDPTSDSSLPLHPQQTTQYQFVTLENGKWNKAHLSAEDQKVIEEAMRALEKSGRLWGDVEGAFKATLSWIITDEGVFTKKGNLEAHEAAMFKEDQQKIIAACKKIFNQKFDLMQPVESEEALFYGALQKKTEKNTTVFIEIGNPRALSQNKIESGKATFKSKKEVGPLQSELSKNFKSKKRMGTLGRYIYHSEHGKNLQRQLALYEWPVEEITRFEHWFDDLLRNYEPLDDARKELKKDPENIVLQEKMKSTLKEREGKILKFLKNFDQNFGSIEKIKLLEKQIDLFNQKAREIGKNPPFEEPLFSQKIIHIGHDVDLIALDTRALSWDANYLKPIAALKSSSWQAILKNKGLTQIEVNKILRLHEQFQKVLKKLRFLHDEKAGQSERVREAEKREAEIGKLLEQYEGLETQIKKLNQAIKDFEKQLLQTKLKDIERIEKLQEVAADLRTFLQVAKELKNLERKLETATGVSFENAHLLTQIHLLDSFADKASFAREYSYPYRSENLTEL